MTLLPLIHSWHSLRNLTVVCVCVCVCLHTSVDACVCVLASVALRLGGSLCRSVEECERGTDISWRRN